MFTPKEKEIKRTNGCRISKRRVTDKKRKKSNL